MKPGTPEYVERAAEAMRAGMTSYVELLRLAIELAPGPHKRKLGDLISDASRIAERFEFRDLSAHLSDFRREFSRLHLTHFRGTDLLPLTFDEARTLSRLIAEIPRGTPERAAAVADVMRWYRDAGQKPGVGVDDPAAVPFAGDFDDDSDVGLDDEACPSCLCFHAAGRACDGSEFGGEDVEIPDFEPIGDDVAGDAYDYAADDFNFDAAREDRLFGR